MAKRFSRRITRKKTYKLSPKNAEEIIKEEFMTPRNYKMQKRFIFKPENPNNSGMKVYFNREEGEE